MKPITIAASVGLCAVLAFGQFGGILNKAKSKIDAAKGKAAPVTDRAEKAESAFRPWSEAQEQELGRATAEKMVAMFKLVDDPAVVEYVNLVGATVARNASRQLPYRFGVLDSEIVSAFALPGGYIFITRGALAGMENEAQLAGALAHEIIHTAERHLETEIRAQRKSTWAIEEAQSQQLPGPEAVRRKADLFLNDLFNMQLSQDKEDASDREGTMLALKSGYSTTGLLTFLESMQSAAGKEENKRMFGQVLSTHPSFASRIEKLKPLVAQNAGKGLTLNSRFAGVFNLRQ
jgi:predicted Zn-dependent protease